MIKKVILCSCSILVFLLAACGSSPAAQASNQQAESGAAVQAAGTPQPGQGQISTDMKLLLGTLSLEGTGEAVSAEQAAELLPLWKAMKSLTASDTTSQDEVNALIQQIQDGMTKEQIAAIDALGITNQSMMEMMQKLGISNGPGNLSGTPMSADQQATRQALRQAGGGGFDPGGGPGGGAGGPGGGGLPPEGAPSGAAAGQNSGQVATAIAGRRGGMGMLNPALLDELIKLLQERAG